MNWKNSTSGAGRRTALATDQNHAWHGCIALSQTEYCSQRAGHAPDRLQSHPRPDAPGCLNLRFRLGATFLQRLAGQCPPFRGRHLCHSPQASSTGPALRRSAPYYRLRFGPTASQPLRTSRSKAAPKKKYQLLTEPRHQMHTAPHRNRPKNHS
jgi:hypothetical protein